ncbi:hypothetical protein AWC38_SpisGene9465, partial [Stylophora pistillata]
VSCGNYSDKHLSIDEGNEDEVLSVPTEVLDDSLWSRSNGCKDVVRQLEEKLSLDRAALRDPDPDVKKLIRYMARKANIKGRYDVIKELRSIVPSGTTAPLLRESLQVGKMPFSQRRELTIALSGVQEWKIFAEKLGLKPTEIRFLDQRTLNPVEAALNYVVQRCQITVGDLYVILNDSELPVIADLL